MRKYCRINIEYQVHVLFEAYNATGLNYTCAMVNLLNVNCLEKSYGAEALFMDLSFGIEYGDHLGVIGPNGAGKSTLLKIISRLETPDQGSVVSPRGTRIAFIPQMQHFDPEKTIGEVLIEAAQEAQLPESELETNMYTTLGKMGFKDMNQRVEALSGGWLKRLTLACGWVQNADLVLLDEPTNHLDLKSILWLQDLLKNAQHAWILVSHDRYFLDQTLSRTMELNSLFEKGYIAETCGYSRFLEKRSALLEQQAQQLESMKNKVRRETEWLRRSPKARTTKARFRVDAAHKMIRELESMHQRAQSQKTTFSFSASDRKTKKLLKVESLSKGWDGNTLIRDLNLLLSPGKRLGLLGINGSGKTTLLKILAGVHDPDEGNIDRAPNLNLVYFDQERRQIDPTISVACALSDSGDQVLYRGQPVHIASWAKRFGLSVDQLPLPVGELSGGEQAKLHIARLMLQTADVLLLDEPTNDLDMETVQHLEESLLEFPGALVLVTHDRYMLNRVCDEFLGLDGKGACTPVASFEQWERSLESQGSNRKKKPQMELKSSGDTKKKLSYREQREFDGMESQILGVEERIEAFQLKLDDPAIASNGAELSEILKRLQESQEQLEQLYERWSQLEAKTP